ncbi:MAG: hypothetical protein ACR2M9_04195, partial [Cyanophyceae cyanobacterium]
VNTTPMHAEDYSVDDLANMQFNEIDQISGFIADRLNHTQKSWSELSVDDRKEILDKIKKDEPWMGWSGEENDDPQAISIYPPEKAVEYLRSGDRCVWLVDYADHNYGTDEEPSYDYPVEDPDDLESMIADGIFDDYEQFGDIKIITYDRMEAEGGSEYHSEPAFARNKRVLIPTAVIGGLALAYFAKPELLSGSFDRISEMLGKMTKKKDKTE